MEEGENTMIELLARLFIRGRDALAPSALRRAYGQLCGAVGIGLNLLLFAVKFFAGSVSGSIAITADAFNNLSDAGSSLVTLLGFRLAGRKPDPEHPFGHGRMEYISGLVVSGLILLMGVELGKSSLGKILHPEEVASSPLVLVILVVSIGVKLYMFSYNRAVGKKIHSTAMDATAMDSLSDAVSTAAVLVAAMQTLCGAAGFTEMYMMDFETDAICFCHAGEGNWATSCGTNRPRLVDRYLGEGGLENPPTILFTPKAGRATLTSLAPLNGDRLRLIAAPGEMLPKNDLRGCEMPYFFWRPDSGVTNCIRGWLKNGGTHHEVISLGDVSTRWQMLCDMWDVEYVQV